MVHATASGDDGGVTITRWAWERSDEVTVNEKGIPSAERRDDPDTSGIDAVGGRAAVPGATLAVYAPKPNDVGRYLRATELLEVPVNGINPANNDQTPESGFVNAAPVLPD